MRAQLAVEFAMMVLIGLVSLVVLVAIALNHLERQQDARGQELVREWSSIMQREALLAAGMSEGYTRTFVLPDEIGGEQYAIAMTSSTVELTLQSGQVYTRLLPNVTGTFQKGTNYIRKVGGAVVISQ